MATGLRRAPGHRCGYWASAAREQGGGGAQGHRERSVGTQAAPWRRASSASGALDLVGRQLPEANVPKCSLTSHTLQHDKQMFALHTYEPPDFGGGCYGDGVQIHHPDEAATVLAVPDEVAVHPQPVVGGLVDGAVGPDVWSEPEAVDVLTPRASSSMLIVAAGGSSSGAPAAGEADAAAAAAGTRRHRRSNCHVSATSDKDQVKIATPQKNFHIFEKLLIE
uniref:Uncharacterized protein n=1 Tax=Oryza sativa subsp. japonica TaxID=39947 RepID=Q2QWX9_ORYSJ|nr:hypothetical protein LOC_Os12g07850 [Oryza sativa Japonica Group]